MLNYHNKMYIFLIHRNTSFTMVILIITKYLKFLSTFCYKIVQFSFIETITNKNREMFNTQKIVQ